MIGSVELSWIGGTHTFRLCTYGHLRLLQEKCDAGPQEILQRLLLGTWKVEHVREIHRIGLLGGGMKPAEAERIVRVAIDDNPFWLEHVMAAKTILLAGLATPAGDDVGKAPAEKAATEASSASPSPQSTAPDKPSDSIREKSTTLPLGSSPPASMAGTAFTVPETNLPSQ